MKKWICVICTISILSVSPLSGYSQSSKNELYLSTIVVNDSVYSNTLEEQREIWVHVPGNLKDNPNHKYPVIYILDGASLLSTLETVYENYWGHYLPNMILVGISNRSNRTRDLTTSQIKLRRGGEMNEATGGAEKFTQFIENELIPYIDGKYPTTSYRTLIGHSYAGLFTINAFVNHNHLFDNFIAIDPSLDWDDQKLLKQAKTKLGASNLSRKSLFVSLAAEQLHMQDEKVSLDNIMMDTSEFSLFARSILDFANFVEEQKQTGVNFSWKVYPNDLHGTVPLPSIRDGLVFLFDWYQFKNPPKYNNPETPIEELKALIKEQEKIYTQHFGYPTPPMIQELFGGYGYMYLQYELFEKAKLFFEMNIEYYPESADAYDSMADYYESQMDISNALKFTSKAYSISGRDYHKTRMEELKGKIK